MSSVFNNIDYKALLIKSGTNSQPLNVVYYSQPRNLITAISQALAAVITITDAIDFVTYPVGSTFNVYINGVLQTAGTGSNVDGAYIATVVSSTSFSVPEDTLTGTPSTFDISNGYVYFEDCIVKNVTIDSYDSSGEPVLLGATLANHRFNIAEGHFEYNNKEKVQASNRWSQTNVIDSRFAPINQSGHSTTLGSTIQDINDSGNPLWIMPGAAVTLYMVSDDIEDAPGGDGISTIFLDGLGTDFSVVQDVIVLSGTTPVASNFQFRALNLSLPLAGNASLLGAAGNITISDSNSATPASTTIWAKYLPGDLSANVGRYTVAKDSQWVITNILINGGADADMTIIGEVTLLGAYPIGVIESYISSQIWHLNDTSSITLQTGATAKWRGFTNSGSPSQRKVQCSFFGLLASLDAWASIQIN